MGVAHSYSYKPFLRAQSKPNFGSLFIFLEVYTPFYVPYTPYSKVSPVMQSSSPVQWSDMTIHVSGLKLASLPGRNQAIKLIFRTEDN